MSSDKFHLKHILALRELIEKKSVSQAAEGIYITQSAMSNILSQFRTVFSDQLIERQGNQFITTDMGDAIQTELNHIYDAVKDIDKIPQKFNPETHEHEFNIAITHPYEELCLQKLIELVMPYQKNIKMNIHTNWLSVEMSAIDVYKKIDMDFFLFTPIPLAGCVSEIAFECEYVIVSNKGHFSAVKNVSHKVIQQSKIVLLNDKKNHSKITEYVNSKTLPAMRVYLDSTHTVLEQVIQSDYISILPKQYAQLMAKKYGWAFDYHQLPFSIEPFKGYINWPLHKDNSIETNWLKSLLDASVNV